MKKNNIISTPITNQSFSVSLISLDLLEISPTNPRKTFSQDEIEKLGNDIKKNGLMHPITIRKRPTGKYEIVVGSRRYRAYKYLSDSEKSFNEIPAFERELSDNQVIDMQFAENWQRENVDPIEEAEMLTFYITEQKMSVQDLAGRLNHHVSYVYRRLSLNNLSKKCREVFQGAKMSLNVAIILSKLPEVDQDTILKNITIQSEEKGRYVYRTEDDIKRLIDNHIMILKDAPFDTSDDSLIGGSCINCPKNTGCNSLLFPEITKEAKCTERACFKVKTDEYRLKNLKVFNDEYIPQNGLYVFSSWSSKETVAKNHCVDLEKVIDLKSDFEVFTEPIEGTTPVFFLEAEKWSSQHKGDVNRIRYIKKIEVQEEQEVEQEVITESQIAFDEYCDYLSKMYTKSIELLKNAPVDINNPVWLRFLFLSIKRHGFSFYNYYWNHIHAKVKFESPRLLLKWRVSHEQNSENLTVDEYLAAQKEKMYDSIKVASLSGSSYTPGFDIEYEMTAFVVENMSHEDLLSNIHDCISHSVSNWGNHSYAIKAAENLGLIKPLKTELIEPVCL